MACDLQIPCGEFLQSEGFLPQRRQGFETLSVVLTRNLKPKFRCSDSTSNVWFRHRSHRPTCHRNRGLTLLYWRDFGGVHNKVQYIQKRIDFKEKKFLSLMYKTFGDLFEVLVNNLGVENFG